MAGWAYEWDEWNQRYRSLQTGRWVSSRTVRSEVDAFIEASQEGRVRTLTNLLLDQRLSLGEWQTQMALEIKAEHTANAVLARGGWEQMTQHDWGRVGAIVKDDYRHLNQWAADLQSGKAAFDDTMQTRAFMYIENSYSTYQTIKREAAKDAGFLYEVNVLDKEAQHCSDCEDMTALGVVPIGTLIPIGERKCGPRDRCHTEQTRNPDGSDSTDIEEVKA